MLERVQPPPGHGHRLVGQPQRGPVPPGLEVGLQLGHHLGLGHDHRLVLGRQGLGLGLGGPQLLTQSGAFRLEGGDDIGIGRRVKGLEQRALPLAQHPGQAPGPLHHAPGPGQGGGQIRLPLGGHLVGGPLGVGVELAEQLAEPLLDGPLFDLHPGPLGVPGVQRGQLRAGQVEPHGAQLVGQAGMGARRGGLALEGPDLTFDFPDQVEQPLQVLLGGGQPPLGPLPSSSVLEDTGRLLDDGSPVLGARLQNGVEVALADDDVLLPAHAGVRQQLLDVEEPAGSAVDGVLAVTRPEEGPGDGDLGQVGGQLAGAVVDGEGDLGPPESRPTGRAHEDDVLHLGRAHRAGALGPEHPGHRVHHVRLPAAVRTHHDGDPGLEFEHRGIGEGLETFERK